MQYKKTTKYILCTAFILASVLSTSFINVSASEETKANQFPIVVKESEEYSEKDIAPRANILYGAEKKISNVYVKPYITYSASGIILDTGIVARNNSKVHVLYDVSYNSNKTCASFAVTVYSKDFFGGVGNALGTNYWTLYSPGPRMIDTTISTIDINALID